MLENEKRKVISVVKRYALTSNRRNSQTFFKASVFQQSLLNRSTFPISFKGSISFNNSLLFIGDLLSNYSLQRDKLES